MALRVRARFQSSATRLLRMQSAYDAQARMRARLERWKLPGFPRVVARKALLHLRQVRALAPPRVGAAVLSTMWNRWTTARRFQKSGKCVFGCSPTACDSIEHYACCTVVREVALRHLRLRLRAPPDAVADFVLADTIPLQPHPQSVLTRLALLIYAVYSAFNAARHQPDTTPAVAAGMMHQAILQGAQGHRAAERVLRELWT